MSIAELIRDVNQLGVYAAPLMGTLAYIGAYLLPQLFGETTNNMVMLGAASYALGITIGLIDFFRQNVREIERMMKKNKNLF